MKKTMVSALIASLSIMAMPIAAMAAEGEKPVQVYLADGSQIAFEAQPFIQEDNTMVQFRPIFEKLGLKVEWNEETKTVTGTGEKTEIKLQIGSKTAAVNGKEMQLEVAPLIAGDYTFVPLRFVGEASGQEVGWNEYERSILIAPLEKQLEWVLTKYVEYYQKENMEGFMSTIDETTPAYAATKQQIAQIFAIYDLDYKMSKIELLESNEEQAEVRMGLETAKVKGPDYKNNTTTAVYVLHKVNGSWKVMQTVLQKIDYMNADKFKDTKPVIAAEDQKSLLAALEKFRALSEKEDYAGMLAMTDDQNPDLSNSMEIAKQIGAAADFTYKYDNVAIIQFKDNTAQVRYTATLEKVKGPVQIPSIKADTVDTWKKDAKGEWKVTNEEVITMEYIHQQ